MGTLPDFDGKIASKARVLQCKNAFRLSFAKLSFFRPSPCCAAISGVAKVAFWASKLLLAGGPMEAPPPKVPQIVDDSRVSLDDFGPKLVFFVPCAWSAAI